MSSSPGWRRNRRHHAVLGLAFACSVLAGMGLADVTGVERVASRPPDKTAQLPASPPTSPSPDPEAGIEDPALSMTAARAESDIEQADQAVADIAAEVNELTDDVDHVSRRFEEVKELRSEIAAELEDLEAEDIRADVAQVRDQVEQLRAEVEQAEAERAQAAQAQSEQANQEGAKPADPEQLPEQPEGVDDPAEDKLDGKLDQKLEKMHRKLEEKQAKLEDKQAKLQEASAEIEQKREQFEEKDAKLQKKESRRERWKTALEEKQDLLREKKKERRDLRRQLRRQVDKLSESISSPWRDSSSDQESKVVYLTFDDGPDPRWTPKILDVLEEHEAVATFFQLGRAAKEHPDIVEEVREAGHRIGNHTNTHHSMPDLSQPEMREELREGAPSSCFRPPYGATNNEVGKIVSAAGLRSVLWDVDTMDWKKPGASEIAETMVDEVRPGSIVLMHDAGGNRAQTVNGLSKALSELEERGYEFHALPC